MSRAHEVYEAQLLVQQGELGPLTQRQKNAIFAMVNAGYQAAIADVKAGGAVAVLDGNGGGEIFFPCDAMYHYWYARNGIALYKLPEDV